ncbi:MAG TPA: hypothetical protein VKB93_16570 [Thermoanaerobaculia bacterium]|nr:hypothetical protein [Thermoanaerobaculia bacterium]
MLLLQIVGAEQTYGPFARPALDSSFAMAAARNGVLVAWSELDATSGHARIRTGFIDASGRLTPTATMPAGDANADAIAPNLATDGTAFYLTQIEAGATQRLTGMPLDAAGRAAAAPRSLIAGYTVTPAIPTSTSLGWNGSAYVVTAVSRLYTLARDGTLLSDTSTSTSTWVGVTPRAFTTATWRPGPLLVPPGCILFCSVFATRLQELSWTSGTRSGVFVPARGRVGTSAVIAGTRSESLIAWTATDGITYFVIDDRSPRDILFPAIVDWTLEPALACDSEHCLLAYATVTGDVHGLLIDMGHADTPKPFAIATSGRRESRPEVVAVPNGFLVGYYSELPGDTRLAKRAILLSVPKRRSAR